MILRILVLVLITLPTFAFGQQLPIFQVYTSKVEGLKPEWETKMKLTLSIFEKVMNDKDFQKELGELKFHSDVDTDPNKNLTTKQIIEKIYAAEEFYNSESDNKADIYWIIEKKGKPWFSKHPAIGYGNETEREIYTYSWFLKSGDLTEIVGHISHEWTHKIGFVHQFNPHDRRPETVPYAFGSLVEKHAQKYVSTANFDSEE